MNRKTAVILEGGGMRGLYSAGVTDALMEKKYLPDAVYGVSAGACHAISWMSNQKGRARRVNIEYCTRSDYCGLRCLIREHSVFGWNLLFHLIPEQYDPVDYTAFFKNCNSSTTSCTFTMVATNAQTGNAVYLKPQTREQILQYAQASSSLPFACPPVTIGSVPCFDGGISDSIPAARALADGYEKLLIVLTQSSGYRKKPQKHPRFIRKFYHTWPDLSERIINRPDLYNKQLELVEKLEREGTAIVLRPSSEVNVGRMERNPRRLQALYENGLADGREALNRFLTGLHN